MTPKLPANLPPSPGSPTTGEREAVLVSKGDLLATLSEHVMDLITLVETGGRRIYASPSYQTLLGFSPEQLETVEVMDLVHPEDAPRVGRVLESLFRGEAPFNCEYRLRHRDGRWLHFESRGTLVPGPAERPPRALLVARDVTARKMAEAEAKQLEVQLRHAQKLEAIGSLAAGIAHEINTPTQYIGDNLLFMQESFAPLLDFLSLQGSFLEVVCKGEAGGVAPDMFRLYQELDLNYITAEIPKAIRQALDGVARVTAIVAAMKEFSHPGEEERILVDLNRAIRNTLVVARSEYKYVAELETDLDPELGPVPCFQGEFNQALLNLVVNAAHAIEAAVQGAAPDRKGRIRVSTARLGEEVRVTVTDNGTGIPPEVRERIFEPFFTTKPVGKGTGQGLAIVRGVVVDKHGGRVEVDSVPGEGTTFSLFLPAQIRDSSGAGQP